MRSSNLARFASPARFAYPARLASPARFASLARRTCPERFAIQCDAQAFECATPVPFGVRSRVYGARRSDRAECDSVIQATL